MKTKSIESLSTAISSFRSGVNALTPFVDSLESPVLYVEVREIEKSIIERVQRLQELQRFCARSIRDKSI